MKAWLVKEFYMHEYGHTIQSKIWGPGYLPVPAIMSLWNLRPFLNANAINHDYFWTETWANTYSKWYFSKYRPGIGFPSTLVLR